MDEGGGENDACPELLAEHEDPVGESKNSDFGSNDGHEDADSAGGENDEHTCNVQVGIVVTPVFIR